MENTIAEEYLQPDESSEAQNQAVYGLVFSPDLLMNIRRCARKGEWALLMGMAYAILLGLFTAYHSFTWLSDYEGDFYLADYDNAKTLLHAATGLIAVALFSWAAWQGRNAMRYLCWGVDGDDDETLAAGFYELRESMRWFGYWAIFLMACRVLERFWH